MQSPFPAAPEKTPCITRRLIGITGKAGSGKDTAADLLEGNLRAREDREWMRKSFAVVLKRNTEHLLSLPAGICDDRVKRAGTFPPLDCSLVRFLQLYGQYMREKFGQNFWIDLLFAHYGPESCWIISDVRYLSEAAYIAAHGGIIIRVECSEEIRAERAKRSAAQAAPLAPAVPAAAVPAPAVPASAPATLLDGRDPKHSSETEMDLIKADYTVVNESTFGDLEAQICSILTSLETPSP